jgi:hypothetical protein
MYVYDFEPTVKEEFVHKAIKRYQDSPQEFDEKTLDLIESHATHYNIPFARADLSASVASLASQVGSGFLSGFTTFNWGDQPKNEWEAIARNIGHLAGFVGYVPSLPFKLLRAQKLAGAAQAFRGKSLPMWTANKVTKATKKVLKTAGVARAGATADAVGFLQNKRLHDIIEGGFHLGVASAVGAWQGGVDEMMSSFIHGAETGAVFRGIGNLINKDMVGFGKKLEPYQLGPGGRPKWKKLSSGQQGDTAIKMMASSLYTGLPSTVRGETTPEQIYNYLLGAYFGYGEMPQETRMQSKYLQKMRKAAAKDPEIAISKDPELLPEWDTLTKREQELVRKATLTSFGTPSERDALVFAIAEEQGISVVDAQKEMAAFEKKTAGEYNEYGEAVKKDSRLKDGTISADNTNTDIGETIERTPIILKAENFVERTYEDTLKTIKNPLEREQKKIEIASAVQKHWGSLLTKAKQNPSEKMVNWLEKEYKVGLDTEAKDFWRQWGEQRMKGKPVMLAGIYQIYNHKLKRYETKTRLLDPNVSDKKLVEPEKPIDTAWGESSERVTGERSNEAAYFIFDHFVKGEKEYTGLEDWRRAQIERAKNVAKRHYPEDWRNYYKDYADSYMRETEQRMWKHANENGYYYFGGRGDAERRYFVKFHPNTPTKEKTIDAALDTIIDMIVKERGQKEGREVIEDEFYKDGGSFIDRLITVDKNSEVKINEKELRTDYKKAFISNVLWEAELNFGGFKNLKDGITKLSDTLGDGFINTAKNFNKRAQIWFNTGYRSNPESIVAPDIVDGNYKYILYEDAEGKNLTSKSKATEYTEISDGAILVRDDILEMINRDQGLPHLNRDGRKIAGFNKSFIVSRHPELGALLGKYAFHAAGAELSKEMRLRGDGLHMMIPKSAAKQWGNRRFNSYNWNKGKLEIGNDKHIYQLPVQDVYNIHSTKQNEHSIHEQRIPKQLLSNLTPFAYKDINPKTIEDIFGRVARDRFLGIEFEGQKPEDVEYNIKMRNLSKNPANESLRIELLDNIDKIGVPHLLEGLRTPGNEAFAIGAYKRIMRINLNIIDEMAAEAEVSKAGAEEWQSQYSEFTHVVDRMLKTNSNSIAIIHHKFARPYIEKVIQNYVVNQLAKPKMKNSLSGAMRPYDLWLQKRKNKEGNTSLLNDRDDIFFLDEGYKDMKIWSRLFGGKSKTLEQFWKEFRDGKWDANKKEVKEIFRSIALRVPMDSISGAHRLTFKGFTGRVGYGVLLHPRTMRALGGADLDGDKVHVFFGDEEYGMKKTWKNMYEEQKEEFYVVSLPDIKVSYVKGIKSAKSDRFVSAQADRKNNIIKLDVDKLLKDFNNKVWTNPKVKGVKPLPEDAFLTLKQWENFVIKHEKAHFLPENMAIKDLAAREKHANDIALGKKSVVENPKEAKGMKELFTETGELPSGIDAGRAASSPVLQYSPSERLIISQAASTGRDMLSAAVVNKNVLSGAYAALMANKDGYVDVPIDKWGQGIFAPPYFYKQKFVMRIEPKRGKNAVLEMNRRARASIAFSSDPMDEAGLKSRSAFFKAVAEAGFTFRVGKVKNGKFIESEMEPLRPGAEYRRPWDLSEFTYKKGLIDIFSGINTALYGRNHNEGRKWSMGEVKYRLNQVDNLPKEMRNTLLPMMADTLKNVDWHDNIFSRINEKNLNALYADYDMIRKEEYEVLKVLFDRPRGVPVIKGAYIDRVMNKKYRLMDDVGREDLIFLHSDKSMDLIKELFAGQKYYEAEIKRYEDLYGTKDKRLKERPAWLWKNEKAEEFRRRIIGDIVTKAQDFITQDLTDMVSSKLVHDSFIKSGVSEAEFKGLLNAVEEIKKESKWMERRYRETDRRAEFHTNEKLEKFKARMDDIVFGTGEVSRAEDQFITDQRVMKLKEGRPPAVERLIDHLMLNSIHKGQLEKVEGELTKLVLKADKLGPEAFAEQKAYLESLRKKVNATSLHKTGFQSKAVSQGAIKEYIDTFSKLFDATLNKPTLKEVERVKGEHEEADKPQIIVDKDGNKVKASFFETGKDKETDKYIDELSPFQGVHKGERTPRVTEIWSELKGHLDYYHDSIGTRLNGMVRWLFGKDLNAMDLEEFESLNRYFDDVRKGTWYQQYFAKVKGKFPKLARRHYRLFPEAIDKDLMREDMRLIEKKGLFLDRMGNSVSGKVYQPMHIIGEGQAWIHAGQELGIKASEKEKTALKESLLPFVDAIEDGRPLHEIAVRIREGGLVGKILKDYKGQAVLGHFVGLYKGYERDAKIKYDWNKLKDKKYMIDLGEGKKVEMTGAEIVEKINEVYTVQNKRIHKWMTGDPEYVDEFIKKHFRKNPATGGKRMIAEFTKMMEEHYRTGDWSNVMEKFGIDGMRRIAQQFMLNQIPSTKAFAEIRKSVANMVIEATGDLGAEYYFPHLMFDRTVSRKAAQKATEIIMNDTTRSKEDKDRDLKKILFHSKQLTGDWVPNEDMTTRWDMMDDVLTGILGGKKAGKQVIRWFDSNSRVGNQHSRTHHIAGWNVEPEAYHTYQKNVIDNFYKHISQIMTRDVIHRWDKRFWLKHKGDKDALNLKDNWVRFFKLYAQQAMGNPSQIPDSYLNNPDMKLKGNPYAWWADSNVEKKVNKIADRLGLNQNQLPPHLKELGGFDYQDIVRWGNLEAKYELASLLAHPKSAVANLYGGTVHTWMNTGAQHLKNARNIEYLMTNVNREWKSMDDVYKWVQKQGIVEEFLMYEADINPQFKSKRWKSFFDDAHKVLKKDPELEDVGLISLAKSHGITEKMFEKAAWFMRRPERTLRRDAFMAHYLQARERFGGAIQQFDHPYLMEMAKKGVKATQFLYSAPFRPMFAGTSLGKVMTRFQLWSWNSVRFRNDKIREASIYGWKPGTKEYERFQRMASADLFMLGMANIFMYSIFENALPAPLNWFQDTAEMLMGDDKERERAFFGAYPSPLQPLQVVTPPIARLLPATFKAIVTDDYTRLADYYVWTMFPFGRLLRDVVGPGGIIENPARTVEKLTGLPYMQFSGQVSGRRDEEMEGPRGLI